MSAGAGSQNLGTWSTGWVAGVVGRFTRPRANAVGERLDVYVAPVTDVEPQDCSYADSNANWAQQESAKVRESLRGPTNLAQRLSGESQEPKLECPQERVLKGEALMVKLIEQRLLSKRQSLESGESWESTRV